MTTPDSAATLSASMTDAASGPEVPNKDRSMTESNGSKALARRVSFATDNLAHVAFWPVLAIAPTSVALAVEAAFGKRARKAAVLAALGTGLGLGLFRWQLARLFAEEPAYVVERRIGHFEIRRYPAVVRAETKVNGLSWRLALDEGFRRLFGYIGKGNDAAERIAMTAPVTTFRDDVASAAPGLAQENEGGPSSDAPPPAEIARGADDVIVGFMMPADRRLESLPAPHDARVQLVQGASRRVAVLRYSGKFDADLTRAKQRELFEAMQRVGLKPKGDPGFAGYDPPTTLPFLRRNEVWIEVQSAAR
jgi:hypothetical protein